MGRVKEERIEIMHSLSYIVFMKIKNLIGIIIGLVAIFSSWYFIQHKEIIVAPGCDQSATATPCSEIPYLSTSSSTEPVSTTDQFNFGELSNTYSDEKFGFSFRYPNELLLTKPVQGCSYFTTSPEAKSAFFVVLTPDCSPDTKLGSLEDYNKDFSEYGEADIRVDFKLLSNESFKTKSGLMGVHQIFSVTSGTATDITRERYIFKLTEEGFLILVRPFDTKGNEYYANIETSVVGSLILK